MAETEIQSSLLATCVCGSHKVRHTIHEVASVKCRPGFLLKNGLRFCTANTISAADNAKRHHELANQVNISVLRLTDDLFITVIRSDGRFRKISQYVREQYLFR